MAAPGRPLVVSVVVADGLVGSFGLGVSAEVFGYDRRAMGLPRFDFGLVSEAPGVLRTDTGIPITVEHGLERLARSDIVLITAWELFDRVPSPALLDAFREAYRSEEHTSELQSRQYLVCRLLLEKKKYDAIL